MPPSPKIPSLPADPRSIWVTDEPPEDPKRQLKHELVREIKRAIEAIALLDLAGAGIDELRAMVDETREIADRLSALPSLAARGGLAIAGGDDSSLLERSGISGRSNPIAPPMHMRTDGDRTMGWACYTAAYEGPPKCLHGGFVAAAFDDLMGVAQMASGSAGYTGTLTVKMLRPTPLLERIDYAAWVHRREGRKIWVRAESRLGEERLAEAEIVFITPRDWGELAPMVRLRG